MRMETKLICVDDLLERMREGGLDKAPNAEQKTIFWNPLQQSRFIESLLIRIPLHAFYIDVSGANEWFVIDGTERLIALQWFVLGNKLKLCGLEFLKDLEGKTYSMLDRCLQRRIKETRLTIHTIESGTSPQVKLNIYERVRASEYQR